MRLHPELRRRSGVTLRVLDTLQLRLLILVVIVILGPVVLQFASRPLGTSDVVTARNGVDVIRAMSLDVFIRCVTLVETGGFWGRRDTVSDLHRALGGVEDEKTDFLVGRDKSSRVRRCVQQPRRRRTADQAGTSCGPLRPGLRFVDFLSRKFSVLGTLKKSGHRRRMGVKL